MFIDGFCQELEKLSADSFIWKPEAPDRKLERVQLPGYLQRLFGRMPTKSIEQIEQKKKIPQFGGVK